MPTDELTPESFRQRPDVVRAVENPRSPRSVLNYMCGCDTAKPEIRDSLNQDETVRALMTIWFQSGRALDAFCQPFAPVVRELKADPPSLIGEEWNSLEGTAAKVLLADQLSRSCFRGSAEADVLPDFRGVWNWNFPIMIPATGEGEFHEEVEVLGGTDRLHPAPGG
jgi:hypothetical protein